MRSRSCVVIDPGFPTMPGRSTLRFHPTRQKSRAPSAKRREVFGESHEGRPAYYYETVERRTFRTLRVLSCNWDTAFEGWTGVASSGAPRNQRLLAAAGGILFAGAG